MRSCTAEEIVPAEHTHSHASPMCSFIRRSGCPRHAGLPRPRRSQRRERCPGDPGVPGCAGAAGEQRTWGSAHVPLCPPPPATQSELAFQGESQHWALGTVSRERGVRVQGLSVSREGWLWGYGTVSVQRECKDSFQAQRDSCTGGGILLGNKPVHVLGEMESAGKCARDSHSNSFMTPGLLKPLVHRPFRCHGSPRAKGGQN